VGCNESSATIEFPVDRIDAEIRAELKGIGVNFREPDPRELDSEPNELVGIGGSSIYDGVEAKITDGIFLLHDSQSCYGEFSDLEEKLQEKGIPFDRESAMDWGVDPVIRVFRPGVGDKYIPLDANQTPTVAVEKIRELLAIDDAGEKAAAAIRRYLDDEFNYPPLADFVADFDGTEGQDRESYRA